MPSTTEPKHIITIDSNITHNVINHLPEQNDELSDPSSYHKLDRKPIKNYSTRVPARGKEKPLMQSYFTNKKIRNLSGNLPIKITLPESQHRGRKNH